MKKMVGMLMVLFACSCSDKKIESDQVDGQKWPTAYKEEAKKQGFEWHDPEVFNKAVQKKEREARIGGVQPRERDIMDEIPVLHLDPEEVEEAVKEEERRREIFKDVEPTNPFDLWQLDRTENILLRALLPPPDSIIIKEDEEEVTYYRFDKTKEGEKYKSISINGGAFHQYRALKPDEIPPMYRTGLGIIKGYPD